jgi:hypothetical protein
MSYPLSSKSDRGELLKALNGLIDDAQHLATKHAYEALVTSDFRPQPGCPEERAAFFYEGQREILKRLRWALSGEAERDGIEHPTVEIQG